MLFFFECYCDHRDLHVLTHSFPPRRSADLPADLSPSGAAGSSSQYDVGAAMSFELDFFGRIRNMNQQALEEYLATEEAKRSVHISLVANVDRKSTRLNSSH